MILSQWLLVLALLYYLYSLFYKNLVFFTLSYWVWSIIVIVHERRVFFSSFFRNISKTAGIILIKKFERNHGDLVYKKMNEHRKNDILRDINDLFCQNVCQYVSQYFTKICVRSVIPTFSKLFCSLPQLTHSKILMPPI